MKGSHNIYGKPILYGHDSYTDLFGTESSVARIDVLIKIAAALLAILGLAKLLHYLNYNL